MGKAMFNPQTTIRQGPKKKQRGQAVVLGMFLMLVAAASVVVLYNTAQTATEKTRLVNAVDASAYSGAVWTARQLNFMAYTNRAMLSNHVMAGHLVSYISWLRYVEDATDNIDDVTKVLSVLATPVPYLNIIMRVIDRAADILEEIAETVLDITEPIGKIFLIGVDAVNRILSESQFMASLNMQVPVGFDQLSTPLHQVMQNTAKYHTRTESIKVNNPEDLASLTGAVGAFSIANDFADIWGFTKRYIPYENATKNRMRYMVNESLGPSERWINHRTWSNNWIVVKIKKEQGDTEHELPSYSGDGGQWSASDRLRYKFPFGKWKTIGEGSASATEGGLYPQYKGIVGYYDIEELTPGSDDRNLNLKVTAYGTMPMAESRLKSLLGMGNAPQKMAAIARAHVFHQRPRSASGEAFLELGEFAGFGGSRNNEYANVYNPFWDAALTKEPFMF